MVPIQKVGLSKAQKPSKVIPIHKFETLQAQKNDNTMKAQVMD